MWSSTNSTSSPLISKPMELYKSTIDCTACVGSVGKGSNPSKSVSHAHILAIISFQVEKDASLSRRKYDSPFAFTKLAAWSLGTTAKFDAS
ncbi:hypothetical protein AVEN_79652-1 [Araneus ventricosus]|uniref:Uncharacterized protein n=1 Tax=Araneus ventricosus TaxID=182803 RepID=A0A4Y2K318_ARAVE|nr:hypothetical protein AVEN_79652-1 [Araneus ventricosus]